MKLNRRQITIIVAALFLYQMNFNEDDSHYKEVDELIEFLDAEHTNLIKGN